jgi:hypothetical protein
MAAFVPFSILFYFMSVLFPDGAGNILDQDWIGMGIVGNFIVILPLQVVVYILMVLNVFIQRHLAARHGARLVSMLVLRGYALMILAAIIGVGVLRFVLGNLSFGF